jgi:hypothetical protein
MFVVVMLAGTVLHVWTMGPLESTHTRQMQQRVEHLLFVLGAGSVENYGVSYLEAVAENLVFAHPRVPGDVLENAVAGVLEYYLPDGHGLGLFVRWENGMWSHVVPHGARASGKAYSFEGKLTLIRAKSGRLGFETRVVLFEI